MSTEHNGLLPRRLHSRRWKGKGNHRCQQVSIRSVSFQETSTDNTVCYRQMPGPAVTVCQGDTVVVDLENHLHTEVTSVHFHGEQYYFQMLAQTVIKVCLLLRGTYDGTTAHGWNAAHHSVSRSPYRKVSKSRDSMANAFITCLKARSKWTITG